MPNNDDDDDDDITAVPAVLKFLKLQVVLKFQIVLISLSFSTNVLILTIVVHVR